MPEYSIKSKCKINTNYDGDTFVGIRSEDGQFSINFPLGFHVSDDERQLRKDILLLLTTIATTVDKTESTLLKEADERKDNGFPIQAYLFLIADFYGRGYYKEREVHYQVSNRGKIDWGRTIKTQKPIIQDMDAYYLKFITRKNPVNENELITLIHEYCVYESFCKIGWLFSPSLPKKPRIKFNRRLFKSVVWKKYNKTFNDKNRELFANMLDIIDNLQDSDAPLSFEYGVDPFDYVWEVLIDRTFGIEGKENYYPKTQWTLGSNPYDNADLKPDTIMVYNGNVYVLDAKNYKYGHTRKIWDLPKSTDINKQITYGEYVAEQDKFKAVHGNDFITYNAFLMPYDPSEWGDKSHFRCIGSATGNWKSNQKSYEKIQGILVDVHFLMTIANHKDYSIIEELANIIEQAIEK